MDPNDKSTWTVEKINMAWHYHTPVQEIAPKAWSAMGQLLGGEERISDDGWSDGFIVNFGKPEYKPDDELDLRSKYHLKTPSLIPGELIGDRLGWLAQ
jgi:hypothetical protein